MLVPPRGLVWGGKNNGMYVYLLVSNAILAILIHDLYIPWQQQGLETLSVSLIV